MTATEQLREEHEGIKLMLAILGKFCDMLGAGEKVNPNHAEGMLEFFQVFADKCHHGKEEDLLFPELEKEGMPKEAGPIAVMLSEHRQGRLYIQGMADALSGLKLGDPQAALKFQQNAGGYISLLRQHILKENQVLFPMAEKALSPQKNEKLLEAFERLETERIGLGKHERFHELLREFQRIYLPK